MDETRKMFRGLDIDIDEQSLLEIVARFDTDNSGTVVCPAPLAAGKILRSDNCCEL